MNYEHDYNKIMTITAIYHRTSSLYMFWKASSDRIKKLSEETKWLDENASRFENKNRMKSFGLLISGYKRYLKELTIIGINKSIEDLIYDLKVNNDIKIKFWNIKSDIKYYKEMKFIRHLNNCIKHNCSLIEDDGGKSNVELIREFDIIPGTEVDSINIDVELEISRCLVFQYNLISEYVLKIKDIDTIGIEAVQKMLKDSLLPDFVFL